MQGWNGLDWALIGVVTLSIVAGLLRGVIRTLFGLAGLFCAFAMATWRYEAAANWVRANGWIRSVEIARGVSYVAIAVMMIISFGIAGAIVRRTAHAVGLGMLDRLVGGIVGAVRGVLAGAALVLAFQAIAPRAELLRSSGLSSYFLAAAHAVSFVVPHSLRRGT